MSTGILSVALALDGRQMPSRILLALAAAAWVALVLLQAETVLANRARLRAEARTPIALTAVAGTAVLGGRLTMLGWDAAAVVLLGIAFAGWLALLPPILRHWTVPSAGASLMLTVSAESLAVLAAYQQVHWLLFVAAALAAIGLAFYGWVIARFDWRQLAVGHGDHWITGGALAISALAAGEITIAAHRLGTLEPLAGGLRTATVVLWLLSIAWLPVLLVAEIAWPRPRYHPQRWATVFPVAMYAACSFVAGAAVHAPAITRFARVWVWAATAVWLVVLAGAVRATTRAR